MTANGNAQNDGLAPFKKESKGIFSFVTYFLAAAVLVAYGFFIYFLIGKVGSEDPDWSRLIYLFSGVEAIVFAAAGFVFGREVDRKRAEKAEQEKRQADKEKEKAKKEVVEERKKGLILGAMAIQGEGVSLAETQRQGPSGMESLQSPKAIIADTARKMYPELRGDRPK